MDEADHIVLGQGRDYLHDLEGEEFRTGVSRELSLARTNAEQSLMWLEKHLETNRKES